MSEQVSLELDARVAGEVMRWKQIDSPKQYELGIDWFRIHEGRGNRPRWITRGRGSCIDVWSPSINIAHAMEVVEHMKAGLLVETNGVSLNLYRVGLWCQPAIRWVYAEEPTLELGIVHAALKVTNDPS